MEKQFWLKKWKNHEIGFHQENYNPYLVKFWDKIVHSRGSVFVPLCGKTKDMLFLVEHGHYVVGVELSPEAVKMFFEENHLSYTVSRVESQLGVFELFKGESIQIYVGSLFDLDPKWLYACEYLYDRASIVALPKSMRLQYADFLAKLKIRAALMITMVFGENQDQNFCDDQIGPPFSIPLSELNLLFKSPHFSSSILETKFENSTNLDVHVGKIKFRTEYALGLTF